MDPSQIRHSGRCCYRNCRSDHRFKDRDYMKDVFFVKFPRWDTARCKRWLTLCGREDKDVDRIDRHVVVCSNHFVGGNGPTVEHPDPIITDKIYWRVNCVGGLVLAAPNEVPSELASQAVRVLSTANESQSNHPFVRKRRRLERREKTEKTLPSEDNRLNINAINNSSLEEEILDVVIKEEPEDGATSVFEKSNKEIHRLGGAISTHGVPDFRFADFVDVLIKQEPVDEDAFQRTSEVKRFASTSEGVVDVIIKQEPGCENAFQCTSEIEDIASATKHIASTAEGIVDVEIKQEPGDNDVFQCISEGTASATEESNNREYRLQCEEPVNKQEVSSGYLPDASINAEDPLVRRKTYRCCIVPSCCTTTIQNPQSLFFHVPRDVKERERWCKLIKRKKLSVNSTVYCCEDHFDLQNDMANYYKYKLMNAAPRLKKGVVPHKFHCQAEQAPKKEVTIKRRRSF